jgi:hypothetical protein
MAKIIRQLEDQPPLVLVPKTARIQDQVLIRRNFIWLSEEDCGENGDTSLLAAESTGQERKQDSYKERTLRYSEAEHQAASVGTESCLWEEGCVQTDADSLRILQGRGNWNHGAYIVVLFRKA